MKNLEDLINKKVLIQDDKECLYVYEILLNGISQTELVVLLQ